MLGVSIHAFRGEGDGYGYTTRAPNQEFQSTPSGGKATRNIMSTRKGDRVSIHAFRGEGDNAYLPGFRLLGVSIHAFRGEGDRMVVNRQLWGGAFQSTPSGGKATHDLKRAHSADVVSIHAFRGEGDVSGANAPPMIAVSIHAFRGEGDQSLND